MTNSCKNTVYRTLLFVELQMASPPFSRVAEITQHQTSHLCPFFYPKDSSIGTLQISIGAIQGPRLQREAARSLVAQQ